LLLASLINSIEENKHPVCFFKRRNEAQYSRIAIMTLHGCSLLDNAGAYCPDDGKSNVAHGYAFIAVTSKVLC